MEISWANNMVALYRCPLFHLHSFYWFIMPKRGYFLPSQNIYTILFDWFGVAFHAWISMHRHIRTLNVASDAQYIYRNNCLLLLLPRLLLLLALLLFLVLLLVLILSFYWYWFCSYSFIDVWQLPCVCVCACVFRNCEIIKLFSLWQWKVIGFVTCMGAFT